MKLCVVASGSKGNCSYIESNNTKILIDAGISKKRLMVELEKINIDIMDINAILITHEHIDHISGIIPIYKAIKCDIYMTLGTYNALMKKDYNKYSILKPKFIQNNDSFDILNININAIPIFHDAADPVGYIVNGNKKLVCITDTGYIHKEYMDIIKNADAYIFECNHDEHILMQSDRPYNTKMRILSDHGHLSNEDALYILANVVGCNTRKVFYAHISDECNLFEIVSLTREKVFNTLNIDCSNIEFLFTSQLSTGLISL